MTIEEGRYIARASEWKLGLTQSGNEQIGVLFTLEDGRSLTWYGYFTDKTTDRTLESLEHMGWDGVDITNPMGLDKNDVSIVVEHELNERDGKTYAKVKWVNKAGGSLAMKEELTGGALQSFKQRMQGAVLARRQASGRPAQRQQRAPTQAKPAGSFSEPDYGFDDRADPYDDIPI